MEFYEITFYTATNQRCTTHIRAATSVAAVAQFYKRFPSAYIAIVR